MKGLVCLCMALTFSLAAATCTQENGDCPHKKTTTTTHRTTTLKTTTQHTTHPHTNHTTLPTTVTHKTKHTTIPSTVHTTTNHTTANHTSAPHTTTTPKHTTANHTSAPHTTATPKHTTANHTSAPHTTATANHTTANHTSAPHTTVTANHTTANHTSAPHTTATANHTTANHTSAPHTTANSTSPPHTSNHTHAPSTTIVPTVNPDITVGEYTVKNGSEICLRAKLGLKLMIQYNVNGSQPVWGSILIPGPNHTVPSGSCSDQKAVLRLSFPEGFIEFTFHKNVSKQLVYMGEILLRVNHTFPRSKERSYEAHNSSLHEFETVIGKSYLCKNLTIDVTSHVALNIVQEQVQAFQLPDGQFGRADHCPMDQPSMAVPIIVGVILAVLIVIVIVAYLIGRRRSYNGYQSI